MANLAESAEKDHALIAYLKGQIQSFDGLKAQVVCNGVGYEVSVPLRALEQLKIGQTAELFVYHHFSPDSQRLFGFLSASERNFFRELTGIKGIGPALALSILSHSTAVQFLELCRSGNVAALSRLPRVGKKTAERLVFEVKDKQFDFIENQNQPMAVSTNRLALEALLQLGYKESEIEKALARVDPAASISDTITQALREL